MKNKTSRTFGSGDDAMIWIAEDRYQNEDDGLLTWWE